MISTACLPPWRAGALLLAAHLLLPLAAAQEAAVVKRATELRDSAADTGQALAPLAAQTAVTRTGERKGAWVQVRTAAGTTGWLHLFDIGPASGSAAATSSGGSGALRGVAGLLTGRGAGTTATSASGIRGLGAEDLAQAQPDPAGVAQMEALRQSETDARDFAARAALQPVAVEPLAAPARPAAGGRNDDPANPQQ